MPVFPLEPDPSLDDLRNPFAQDAAGRLVHAARVRDRADGPFICPGCQGPLTFRNGQIRQLHFAHEPGADCQTPVETMLHRFGKELIAREKRLRLPALWVSAGDERREAHPEYLMTFDRFELEV